MNRTFWAGFGVAVIVILLPVLFLIDARSSMDRQQEKRAVTSGSDRFDSVPDKGFSDTPSLPTVSLTPSVETTHPVPPNNPPTTRRLTPTERENPEIVFSPNRVRRSIARDPRRDISSLRRQKPTGIRSIVYDPSHVYTIRTAVSHVTLIDLPEEAKEVYLGDSKLFQAEVFGARVKIKPITWDPSITTNMIIYTTTRQFAFRLKVVDHGEDDLLTFYLPKSGTVVNLNPIRKKMEKELADRERSDLKEKALVTLRSAGASDPIGVWSEQEGIKSIFLGFSGLGSKRFALFEVENETNHPVTLTGIRLRIFHTSLFWEGKKEWVEGEDFSEGYHLVISAHRKKRALLLANPPKHLSAREGYLAQLRVEGIAGEQQIIELEKRGAQ